MRREDFKVLDVPISVQIHTPRIIEQQDNGDDVFDIESTLSPQMKDSIAKFTGSGVQIDKMRDILHHVSLFYSMYLRTITGNEKYIRVSDDPRYSRYREVSDSEKVPLGIINKISKDDDVRGRYPLIGQWERKGDTDSGYIHSEENIAKRNDVKFRDYHEQWKIFHRNYCKNTEISFSEGRKVLRESGMGELQSWMFWRYFSGRTLDCSTWTRDLPIIHEQFNRQTDQETFIEWGERVWGDLGGTYTSLLEGRNLSAPNRTVPCAYPLGCVQNIQRELAPFANQLSWELEHSRPGAWGGGDVDTQVMCTHHNRLKSDNFIFDVNTLSNIISLHERK
jgi:hypothetical protein